MASMFTGLRTVVYRVADLDRAKSWWTNLLRTAPYFDQPFYVGYNVGGYELGLVSDSLNPDTDDSRSVTYWGVEDVEVALRRLLDVGATQFHALQDVGDGIRLAAVLDPFGNVVGVIYNPHFSLPVAG